MSSFPGFQDTLESIEGNGLSSLDVKGNFTSQQMIFLFEALKRNTSVHSVALDACGVDHECMSHVVSILAQSKTVSSFRLTLSSTFMGTTTSTVLCDMLCVNTSIECLTLCGNDLHATINGMLDLCCRALQHNKTITQVAFSHLVMTRDDVQHLCDALRRHGNVKSLQLNIEFHDAHHAALTIASLITTTTNQNIDTLGLTGTSIDNEFAQIICTNATNLTSLELEGSSMQGKEGDLILFHLLSSTTKLKKLVLGDSQQLTHVSALCEGLKSNTSLTMLDLCGCNLQESGKALGDALRRNKGLCRLDLVLCMLDDEQVEHILSALEVNKTLKHLRLEENPCTSAIASSMRNALLVNDTLAKLNLSEIKLGLDGAVCVAEILQQKTALKSLGLSCTNLCVKGLEAISKALCINQSLQSIELLANKLTDECAPLIRDVLKSNHSLKKLDVGFNRFSPEGFRILFDGMLHNRTLRRFACDRNPLNAESVGLLCQIFETNHNLSKLNFYPLEDGVSQLSRLMESFRSNGSIVAVSGYERHFEQVCVRNRKMHHSTMLSCRALLALRRFRQSYLHAAPRDVVQMIALALWATRSDFVWV